MGFSTPRGMCHVNVFPNPTVNDFKLQVITAGKEIIHARIIDAMGHVFENFENYEKFERLKNFI